MKMMPKIKASLIRKLGGSRYVLLPWVVCSHFDVSENDEIEMELDEKGRLCISFIKETQKGEKNYENIEKRVKTIAKSEKNSENQEIFSKSIKKTREIKKKGEKT